jgi:hypothetical protein
MHEAYNINYSNHLIVAAPAMLHIVAAIARNRI